MASFVDVHSHVVPSDDDGARTIGDGLELCADAAEHGTALLFATPHVWPVLPLTDEREHAVRAGFDELRAQAPLELRLGFELTPTAALLRALEQLAERGRVIQVNGSSLLGYHGAAAEEVGWWLVEEGLAGLVASDGHRPSRPARLDAAFAAVEARVGEGATALFDGSAFGGGLANAEPTRSRGASTGA